MKVLKRFIRNIIFDVVQEHHNLNFTNYQLIDNETGEKIDEHCKLSIKPSKGDLIMCDDSIEKYNHIRFKVVNVEYSSSGLNGVIYGTVTPKLNQDFEGTEKGEMLEHLKDIIVMHNQKMLGSEFGITVRKVIEIKELLSRLGIWEDVKI